MESSDTTGAGAGAKFFLLKLDAKRTTIEAETRQSRAPYIWSVRGGVALWRKFDSQTVLRTVSGRSFRPTWPVVLVRAGQSSESTDRETTRKVARLQVLHGIIGDLERVMML